MAAKFELKKSKNDKFVFNLLAANGQVILTSEMYESRASALNGIEAVRKNAPNDGRFGRLGGSVLRDAGIPPQDAAQAVPLGRAGHYGGTGGAGRVSYLVPVKEIKEAEKPPHCCGGFSVLVTIV